MAEIVMIAKTPLFFCGTRGSSQRSCLCMPAASPTGPPIACRSRSDRATAVIFEPVIEQQVSTDLLSNVGVQTQKTRWTIGSLSVVLLRWVLGGVFIYMGLSKALHPEQQHHRQTAYGP